MISPESFQKLALNFDQVNEQPHFDKTSFRIKGKIFATSDSVKRRATLKLSEIDQSVYCQIRPAIAAPATGAWGKHGWTVFDLTKATKTVLIEALKKAYLNVAPKEKVKASKNAAELIQTLHPVKGKINKKIALEKYNTIKDTLLKILHSNQLTHTELIEQLSKKIRNSFEGNVQWYGETVKLDLEARKIIERTGSKPENYRLKSNEKG